MSVMKASGHISFTCTYDAKTIVAFLSSNHPLTQIFGHDNKSYLPNYAASGQALVLTPEVFVSGAASSVISQLRAAPVWKINGSGDLARYGAVAAKTAPYALTISKNLDSVPQLRVECEMIHVDPTTNSETTAKAVATITKTENAGRLIQAIVYPPKGNIFKQGIDSLTAKAELRRGSVLDNTDVTYRWEKMQPDGRYIAVVNGEGISGQGTHTLTIKSSEVLGVANFQCVITDTDRSSGTYNTTASAYVSFVDLTDPYQVSVYSPSGSDFRNGVGSKTVSALVYQGGVLVQDADGTKFDYSWAATDEQGNKVTNWGTNGTQSGKTVTVESPKHTKGKGINLFVTVSTKS